MAALLEAENARMHSVIHCCPRSNEGNCFCIPCCSFAISADHCERLACLRNGTIRSFV